LGLPFALGFLSDLGLAVGDDFIAATAGLAAIPVLAAGAFGRGVAVGFAARVDLAFAVDPAIAPDLAAVVIGLAAAPDLAVPDLTVPDLAVPRFAVPDLAVPRFAVPDLAVPDLAVPDLADATLGVGAVPDLVVVFGRAVVLDLAAVFGAAADTVLTAAVRDLVALVMALVALFIACMAVDIVLAEDVAFVAAAVIFVAAEVTLVAADETVRTAAVDAVEDALRVVVRVALTAVARVPAFVAGRRAARLGALPLVDLVRPALAGLRRAAVRVVVRAGTDLPPSRSITEVLFHQRRRFTHPMTIASRGQWCQADRKRPLIPGGSGCAGRHPAARYPIQPLYPAYPRLPEPHHQQEADHGAGSLFLIRARSRRAPRLRAAERLSTIRGRRCPRTARPG
jgi:hypothetical protein